MTKYRKKPTVVEAERVSVLHWRAGHEWASLPVWARQAYNRGELLFLNQPRRIEIKILTSTVTANFRDMLVYGEQGKLYPCEPEVFAQNYELMDDDD